jgi:hypothetical protein
MRRLAMVIGSAVTAMALSVTAASADRRVALVIGNGSYQNATPLPNPTNDARAMADLFRKAGFDLVQAHDNLGNLEIKRAIREFTLQTRDADIAVIYFAGHGIEVGGTNYLIPVDARLASDFDVEDEALALDRVVRALEPARRLRLIILDACRDNPFLKTMKRSFASRAVSNGLAKVEPTTTDTLIAFAAKAGSTADDGRGEHSPFTLALMKNLAVPGLDIRLALGRVRDEVLKATGNKQEPFVYGSLGGATVALVPEPRRETPAASPAAPAVDVRRDYELAERIGTREAWDLFLAQHKSGFYADLARAARAKLDAGSSAPAQASASQSPAPGQEPAAAAAPPRNAVAVLSPPDAAASPPAVDPAALPRALQGELKRVGCDPGAVDGDWGAASRRALERFNKSAGTTFDIKAASAEALEAVRAKTDRVCVAAVAPEPAPPQRGRALKDRPAVREIIRRSEERRPHPRGGTAAACQTPITVGGRQCCTFDSGGAPRIICQ